jgi:hypothetical protein
VEWALDFTFNIESGPINLITGWVYKQERAGWELLKNSPAMRHKEIFSTEIMRIMRYDIYKGYIETVREE